MGRNFNRLFIIFALILSTACTEENEIVGPNGEVNVATDPDLGDYLVDGAGNALYYFAADLKGSSACTSDQCLNNWSVFNRGELSLSGNKLQKSNFGTITREDNLQQVTYKGWPLYHYDGDNNPGEINGDGIDGEWFVAKPDYALMLGKINDQNYLVDEEGMVLYRLSRDQDEVSVCVETCRENWPPFYKKINNGEFILPSVLEGSNYNVLLRDDGRKQISYKGWPLYYFIGDEKKGQINSEGAYNSWFTINPFKKIPSPPPAEKNLKSGVLPDLGEIIIDGEERALYINIKDVSGNSTCKDGCLDRWPVFYTANYRLSPDLDISNFGTIQRRFSSGQSTHKGWPLYYYAPDADGEPEPKGSTQGNGIDNEYFVAKPDYTVLLGKQTIETGEEPKLYLTDAKGRTLYLSKKDSFKVSNCSQDCLGQWEPFYKENIKIPSLLQKDNFGFMSGKDGEKQVTYKGWPLYYYIKEDAQYEERGKLNGEGINDVWFSVKPKEIKNAPQ